ncbi:MAG: hypothetical protein V1817_02505 [Candidatus Micrarchaeota archaeon]
MKKKAVDAIKEIHRRLKGKNVTWVITASASLALQGIDVEPHDIDIATDVLGEKAFGKIFSEGTKPVKLSETNLFRSHISEFTVKGLQVHVVRGFKAKLKGNWWSPKTLQNAKKIRFKGMTLRVSNLQEELFFYENSGRRKDAGKARKIRAIIEN